MYRQFGKRLFDLVAGGILLLLTLPLQLLIGFLLWVYWRGNPLFFQQRIGYQERTFWFVKFRSMRAGNEPDEQRLTPVGKWLRRTSLDELPQLWLVLYGSLSLVGPRPLFLEYLPHYSERQRLRHTVRPGITGLAVVKGRNLLSWPERLAWDAQYAERLSLALDLWILWQTLWLVLARRGISAPGRATMAKFTDTHGTG